MLQRLTAKTCAPPATSSNVPRDTRNADTTACRWRSSASRRWRTKAMPTDGTIALVRDGKTLGGFVLFVGTPSEKIDDLVPFGKVVKGKDTVKKILAESTDGERLMRFRLHREEAAFREVVEAHASMVWGVCWQVLRHSEDVEDAFQATFLILARKARTIRAADSAAGGLYRVAFRTALAARQRVRARGEGANSRVWNEPVRRSRWLSALRRQLGARLPEAARRGTEALIR